MKKRDKKPIYKRVWFWILIIVLMVLVVSVSYFIWIYISFSLVGPINPKLPDVPKLSDFLYCEKDADCVISIYSVDNCCIGCGRAINIRGKQYVEEWYNLNCVGSHYKGCPLAECMISCGVRCENNKCIVNYNC